MSSLSYSDLPVTASGRSSVSRSYRSVHQPVSTSPRSSHDDDDDDEVGGISGGCGDIDGIDPEKADILSPDRDRDLDDNVDVELDRAIVDGGEDGWDSDVDGIGPEKSQATVWRTCLCKYRYVLAGVAVLVLASMFAGIAIGRKHGGGSRSVPVPASAATDAAAQAGEAPSIPDEEGVEPPAGEETTTTTSSAEDKAQPGVGQPEVTATTTTTTKKPLSVESPSDNNIKNAYVGGGGGADSLSYSNRRRRRVLNMGLHKLKLKKEKQKSAKALPSTGQRKWKGGTLE